VSEELAVSIFKVEGVKNDIGYGPLEYLYKFLLIGWNVQYLHSLFTDQV